MKIIQTNIAFEIRHSLKKVKINDLLVYFLKALETFTACVNFLLLHA